MIVGILDGKLPRRLFGLLAIALMGSAARPAPVNGWLSWRGPNQDGVSPETGLPDKWTPGGEGELWTYKLQGRGAPVIAGDRVYSWGYEGTGSDLQEVLVCLELETGKRIWEKRFNDYISDTVYSRYSIGSPTIDPQNGNIYLNTTAGEIVGFTPAGEELWRKHLMESHGRLTFPNGRTGAPVIDGDKVIVHGITSNWGAEGAARDRFYAFDKLTGEQIWSSSPGITPYDSSHSTPVLAWRDGQRVLYATTGCGNIVCINAETGQALWRFQLSQGGMNVSVQIDDKAVYAVHGVENVDNSETGRMAAIKLPDTLPEYGKEEIVAAKEAELWRLPISHFTSSPTKVGDRLYQVDSTGVLFCIDKNTGKPLWEHKLDNEQLHSSPLYADGKLYIAMVSGLFYIIKPADAGPEILAKVQMEGEGIGSPVAWNGKVFVHTTEKLYCFGKAGANPNGTFEWPMPEAGPAAGKAVALQVVPNEVALAPGEKASFRVRGIDAKGRVVAPVQGAQWAKFIPPTAAVKSEMDAAFQEGVLVASAEAKPSAGAFRATADGISGTFRGRVVAKPPVAEDFDAFELAETEAASGAKFAYPPLPWIGARFKWEVRELDGNKVLAKTLDRLLFQRSMAFLGYPEQSGYTLSADVRTDGNRRVMGMVGLINQRYIIALIGNWQQLEVSSNHERLKVAVPFKWEANKWYRLKTRVDNGADGSTTVRAKAWVKGEPEPEAWTIEAPHAKGHTSGAPGIFGFSPQNQVRVFVDNISVESNQ